MIFSVEDWQFDVNIAATREKTQANSRDHCMCGYCKNYYETVNETYPGLVRFLSEFGIDYLGPSEVMPFQPTIMLACYRVYGRIISWGTEKISVGNISIVPEAEEDGCFFLWVGEMELPWVQEEDMEEVVSPANLPEFLERMENIWLLRHGNGFLCS